MQTFALVIRILGFLNQAAVALSRGIVSHRRPASLTIGAPLPPKLLTGRVNE
jgi:hypothetical protein